MVLLDNPTKYLKSLTPILHIVSSRTKRRKHFPIHLIYTTTKGRKAENYRPTSLLSTKVPKKKKSANRIPETFKKNYTP